MDGTKSEKRRLIESCKKISGDVSIVAVVLFTPSHFGSLSIYLYRTTTTAAVATTKKHINVF